MADDYFAAIQRIEQRLEIGPEKEKEEKDEVVKVQDRAQMLVIAYQLAQPELCFEDRLGIAAKPRELCGQMDKTLSSGNLAALATTFQDPAINNLFPGR